MIYSIIKQFSPDNKENWNSYCSWRGLIFEKFDSLDGALRPSLFTPLTEEDWDNVIQNDFMMSYINNYEYAKIKHEGIANSVLVGLELDDHDPKNKNFLGFDILDHCFDVSLLTNWGNDLSIINRNISTNALVKDESKINEILLYLKSSSRQDYHTSKCKIISVYDTC